MRKVFFFFEKLKKLTGIKFKIGEKKSTFYENKGVKL